MSQRFFSNPTHDQIPHSADVVIIGGGPAGTAALWAISRAAPQTRIVLIERSDRLGAGSSLASLECYRTCWPTLCLARQMARSVEVFHNADAYLGEGAAHALALKEHGYLFCAFTNAQAAALATDVAHLHGMGLPHIEYLDAAEVRHRFGWLGDRVIAAKYDPTAGWLDSNALIYRYARSAPSATILLGVQDTQIRVEHGRVRGVSTPHGDIAAPHVVIASGASARAVGRSAGIELPVVLRPRQSFTTGWRHDPFPEDAPMIIGAAPYPHVRVEAKIGAIFGWEYQWRSKSAGAEHGTNDTRDAIIDPVTPSDRLKDSRFPSVTLLQLARQFGHTDGEGFADPRYLRGVSHNIGYYVYRDASAAYRTLPDGRTQPYDSERALIDAVPNIEGLTVSIAHAGHGIMTSPAAGEIAACKVLGHPLSDPSFSHFGWDVPWVDHDENAL